MVVLTLNRSKTERFAEIFYSFSCFFVPLPTRRLTREAVLSVRYTYSSVCLCVCDIVRVRLVLDGAISPLLIGGNQKSEIKNQIYVAYKKLEDTSGYRMSS